MLFDGERGRTVLGCRPCARSEHVDPEPQLALDPTHDDVPRWVGLLPYEALRGIERERFSGEE